MDVRIGYRFHYKRFCLLKAQQLSLQYKRLKKPKELLAKIFTKIQTLKGISASQYSAKLQRPEDTEAAQRVIQVIFIRAFQVYSDSSNGCKQMAVAKSD